ncbi:MAG: hypothetical protein IPN96_03910 [Anaerolineales bacterium]|uniref:hypothetical protein n=1 Tax=Candidatus Villigracilis proximus TaxID=3140683 RepID=UPI003136BD78|nr:hypothetical protein [Anaerolineales bacterium]MBK9209412.1 hypothetical protein [Anaerolineales bacterium]
MNSEFFSNEHPIEEKLPYATRLMFFPNGTSVEEFIIPDEDKEIVLEQLYPFSPIPKLTDEVEDMHAGKKFIVKDFRVTWEHGINYLVSPYYPESGGTVIDWIDENNWVEFEEDEFDDDDLEFTEGNDDDIPF